MDIEEYFYDNDSYFEMKYEHQSFSQKPPSFGEFFFSIIFVISLLVFVCSCHNVAFNIIGCLWIGCSSLYYYKDFFFKVAEHEFSLFQIPPRVV